MEFTVLLGTVRGLILGAVLLTLDRGNRPANLGFLFTMLYSAVGSPRGDISKSSVRIYDCFVFPLSRVLDQAGASRLLGKNLAMLLKRPSP